MSNTSLDKRSPGRVQSQQFAPGGGLQQSNANGATQSTDALIMENCLFSKRLGAIVRRPGSVNNSPSAVGFPLLASEYSDLATTGLVTTGYYPFACFSGAFYYKGADGTWNLIASTDRAATGVTTKKQFSSAQLNSKMIIASDFPVKWDGPGTKIERVGIEPPTTLIGVSSVLGPITLKTGAIYVYTYFDSISLLESDWSIPNETTGPQTAVAFTLSISVPTRQNFDSVKVYRCLDGGASPYLVTTISLPFADGTGGTVNFTDTLTDAELTDPIEDRYERAVPPRSVLLCAKYGNRIWMVDATNPHILRFSRPYTGDVNDLEYYPVGNYVVSNEPITALFVLPGKMLVFHSRLISYVSGASEEDFSFQPWLPGVGTLFPNSISTNGQSVVFLDESGFVKINLSGGTKQDISRPIDTILQPILAGSYNSSLNVSTSYNPGLKQFIFMLSAKSTAGAPWEDESGNTSDAISGWQDDFAVTAFWDDDTAVNSSDLNKIKIWGYSEELSSQGQNPWCEYTFSDIANDNSSDSYPVLVHCPRPMGAAANPQQDRTFIYCWNGTNGIVKEAFKKGLLTDSGNSFTSKLLTGRIQTGEADSNHERFYIGVGFDSTYSDPTSSGTCTLKYLRDYEDPHLRNYAPSLITIPTTDKDVKRFPSMQAKHIHLYVEDSSQSEDKILLSQFYITFRERLRRGAR